MKFTARKQMSQSLFRTSGGSEKSRLNVEDKLNLSPFPTDAASELDILGHDGHALGVDGTQVGVLEEPNQVSLASFLQRQNGRTLEPQLSLEILGYFTNQTLERQLSDEKLGALLVTANLSEGHCTRTIAMRFLDASSCGCRFAGGLGRQLLSRCFASCTLTSSLFCTSHGCLDLKYAAYITRQRMNVRRKERSLYIDSARILRTIRSYSAVTSRWRSTCRYQFSSVYPPPIILFV